MAKNPQGIKKWLVYSISIARILVGTPVWKDRPRGQVIPLPFNVILLMLDQLGVATLGDEVELMAIAIQRGDVDMFVTRHLAAQVGVP